MKVRRLGLSVYHGRESLWLLGNTLKKHPTPVDIDKTLHDIPFGFLALMREQSSAALQPMRHRRKCEAYTKRIIIAWLAVFGCDMQFARQNPLAEEDYKMTSRLLKDLGANARQNLLLRLC